MRAILFVFLLIHFALLLPAQIVGTFAGIRGEVGYEDGPGLEATFYNPHGIAISQSGNVYVTDRFNHLIRKITPGGQVSTLAGSPGVIGDADGTGSDALFYEPWGICVDADENIFVADTRNNKIKKITPDGEVTTYAGTGNYGTTNGASTNCTFGQPVGIEVDSAGNIYVADHGTHIIRKINTDGFVTTFAGVAYITGDNDGPSNVATFNKPYGLTLDLQGNILVADEWNHKIRRISPQGEVSTIAGIGVAGGQDGDASTATFNYPWDISVDSSGVIYVADGLNASIRKIIPDGDISITTLAGMNGSTGNADGIGVDARFSGATGVAFSPLTREIFVADAYNNLIRKITDLEQGVLLGFESGSDAICPEDTISIRAYPNVYDSYHFYLNDVLVFSSESSEFDTTGISSGLHSIKVVGELDTFQVTSENLDFEVFQVEPASINIIGNTTFWEGDSVILVSSFGMEYFWSNGADTASITVRESGNYFVEVIDQNTCSSVSDSVEVTVRLIPEDISISFEGDISFCEGEQIELRSNQKTGNQWIKDNWPITGATDSVFIAEESGVYRVQYINNDNIVVISDPIEITVFPVTNLEISADQVIAIPGVPIQFSVLNENLISAEWDFGDPESGIHNSSFDLNPTHEFSSPGSFDITLEGIDENGCNTEVLIVSEFITIIESGVPAEEEDVFIATAFTPNEDGENDKLFVRGSDFTSLNLKVFNQRGEIVFESDSKDFGWDGNYKNKKSPKGNYIFQLRYTNLFGEERERMGVVTLIR